MTVFKITITEYEVVYKANIKYTRVILLIVQKVILPTTKSN